MIAFASAWQFFWLQTKRRDNLLLLLTLFSLAYYLCLISLTGSSVQQFLQQNLRQLLGGDSVLISTAPLSGAQLQQLQSHSSALTLIRQFELNLTVADKWQLTQIKAVDQAYPLQGELKISRQTGLSGQTVRHGPATGEIWLDPRVMAALSLQIGDTLTIGSQGFLLSAVLLEEPDLLLEGHSVTSRAMLNQADLSLLQLPEQQKYRYLMRNTEAQQLALQQWSQPFVQWQLLSQQQGNHPLAALWHRVQKFSGLSAVLLFLLGAITLDLIGKRLAQQQQYYFAVCLANGMTQRQCRLASCWLLLFPALFSLTTAVLLAILTEQLATRALQVVLPDIQSLWQWQSLVEVCLLCFVLFVLTQLPVLIALHQVRIRDLLRQLPVPASSMLLRVTFPLLTMLALVGFYSDNWRLTGLLVTGLAACLLLLLLMTWLTLWCGEKFSQRSSSILAVAFYMMRQRIAVKSAQIIGIGMSLTLLTVSLQLTNDVIDLLEQVANSQDGDLVVDRANAAQVQALQLWAEQQQASVKTMQPFADAQLLQINQRQLSTLGLPPNQTLRELQQGVRLHWSAAVPVNNKLIAGKWLPEPPDMPAISVEDEVAEDLALALGDVLTFQTGQQQSRFKIASIHQFAPGHGSLTFWFVLHGQAPAQLVPLQQFMGSLDVPDDSWPAVTTLWQQHPSLRMVPFQTLKTKLEQFSYSAMAVVLIFSTFIALVSSLLMAAAIKGYELDDRQRNGLMLSFGLSKRHCLQLIGYEWLLTALIPVLATLFSTVYLTNVLYQQYLGAPYQPAWLELGAEVLSSVLGIAVAGIWLCRAQLKVSIKDLLQEN